MLSTLLDLWHQLHTVEGLKQIIVSGGLVALVAIVFAETGLLVGFFLPGDSLLVTAGVFASTDGRGGTGLLNVYVLLLAVSIAAIVGDQVGFMLGRKTGDFVFSRPDSLFFKKKHVTQAHAFYERNGGKAIVVARFVPILRTFVPFVAGVAKMRYRDFVSYNILGGILWVFSMILLGYYLGTTPLADKLHKVILVVIVISVLPLVVAFFRRPKNQN